MKEHKVKVVILTDGKVVPIRIDDSPPLSRPLRGLSFRYDHPFAPAVDESEGCLEVILRLATESVRRLFDVLDPRLKVGEGLFDAALALFESAYAPIELRV